MDLSQIEGLTEEQQAAIAELHTAEVNGLVAKKDELLGKVKNYQTELTAKEQAALEAQQAADAAKEEALKNANDHAGLKEFYEKQLAEREAELMKAAEDSRNALTQRDKGDVINSILTKVKPELQQFVKANLENIVQVAYNDDGKPNITFKEGGQVVANDADSFIKHAVNTDSWKSVLLASHSSGAGSQQGSANETPLSGKAAELARIEVNRAAGKY